MRSLCIGLALVAATAQQVHLRKVAEWELKSVATVKLARDLPGLPGTSLVGTTFQPFGKDTVFCVGPLSEGQDAKVTTLSDQFSWPNEVYQVPKDVRTKANSSGNLLMVADGFLFPGKQTGGIHLLEVGDGLSAVKTTISEEKHAWFYHHSEWYDIDADGIADVVAARAIKPLLIGHTDSELVWMKNHGNGTWGGTQVITKGPGVGFRVVDIDGDGFAEIVASEFFLHQQLAIYSCSERTWAECAQKQNVAETVIDSSDGPFFQLSWVDLNGDGKKDILATAQQHQNGSQSIPGKVLAFEQPKSGFSVGMTNWSRHVLADGYLPQPKQPQGSGAPGTAQAFYMEKSAGRKPHIVLSGDDGGVVDLLSPVSEETQQWSYTKQTLYTSTTATSQGVNTVGTVMVGDVDGTGAPELFIPSYAEGKLLMFTFESEDTAVLV
eukprot:TRINITY_DN42712_c0_g1_i1.p1 TRINITY_DN42712_c0_g1~~TRINITY_DN42712_c0_g1_i1.p1  ORF type:complete len:437 (-),score=95.38 TRINITY_DN42712_c0_g1_i1:29-1339(-)